MKMPIRRMRSLQAHLAVLTAVACSSAPASDHDRSDGKSANVERLARDVYELERREDSLSLDTSTPDRALRSFWSVDDRMTRTSETKRFVAELDRLRSEAMAPLWSAVLAGAALESKTDTSSYPTVTVAREIIEVKSESESRAVVLARVRNTTPIPPGVVLSEKDIEERRDGKAIRYILEKFEQGWRVVQTQSKYYDGADWHNQYEPRTPATWIYSTVSP